MFSKQNKDFVKKQMSKIEGLLKSKPMLCAVYAYEYEKTQDESRYLQFEQLWCDFNEKEKENVITYFYSFNNYEMLKRLTPNDANSSKIQKMMAEFVRRQYIISSSKKGYQKVKK